PPPRPGSLAPNLGDHGPSDSALAASSDWRLRQPAADRHAARCASRDLCSGARHSAPCALGGIASPPPKGMPWRNTTSASCTLRDTASHRITSKPTNGLTLLPHPPPANLTVTEQ